MKDIVKKSFLLGLGAATLTKNQAEKIVKELVKKNAVTRKDGKDLLKRVSNAANDERERIISFVAQEADRISKSLGLLSKAHINNVKNRIKLIDKKLSSAGKKTLKSALNQLSK